ncbi:MAG: MerR family DNA-binding transcriptional regulator [Planctomycetota bacterium]
MPSESQQEEVCGLSIGQVAEMTGLSPAMIRVWERRYGRPRSLRLPSGHRRYSTEESQWLRRAAEGLSLGLRAKVLATASDSELDRLLTSARGPQRSGSEFDEIIEAAHRFDSAFLRDAIRSKRTELRNVRFVHRFVRPLLVEVGKRWADGNVMIRHEHFISEALAHELVVARDGVRSRDDGPVLLLATLTGEHHNLGMLMATLLAEEAGYSTRVLGRDTPAEEVALCASEIGEQLHAVVIGSTVHSTMLERELDELRDSLPASVPLLIGGRGGRAVRRSVGGLQWLDSLDLLVPALEEVRPLPLRA